MSEALQIILFLVVCAIVFGASALLPLYLYYQDRRDLREYNEFYKASVRGYLSLVDEWLRMPEGPAKEGIAKAILDYKPPASFYSSERRK